MDFTLDINREGEIRILQLTDTQTMYSYDGKETDREKNVTVIIGKNTIPFNDEFIRAPRMKNTAIAVPGENPVLASNISISSIYKRAINEPNRNTNIKADAYELLFPPIISFTLL